LSFVKKLELNGPTWLGTKDSWFERRWLIGQVLSMTDSSKCRCWDSILGKKETNWIWRWCGGILGFYSVRQIFFQSDSFSKLPDRMSDKLSWIFDMSVIWSRLLWNTIQVWPTLLVHISFLKQSYYVYLSLVHRPFRNNPQIFSCWDFFLMDVFEH
jgi:hypothetical protein